MSAIYKNLSEGDLVTLERGTVGLVVEKRPTTMSGLKNISYFNIVVLDSRGVILTLTEDAISGIIQHAF